ncbi:MAG: ABC transporter permease [Pseudomonadales bacterium]
MGFKLVRFDLLSFYVQARLRAEVKQTYLSYAWWVLEPLFLMAAFYFVFEILLKRGGPGYIYSLLVGVVVWTWFANTINQSANSIFRATTLISQVYVSKTLFPFAIIFIHLIKQLIVFVLLLVFLALTVGVKSSWFVLPALMLTQLALVAGFGTFIAALVPFLPDLHFVVSLGVRFLMFCSGVFFTVDRIDIKYQHYFMMNPMANLIEQYRQVLLYGEQPHWPSLAIICAIFCLLFIFSVLLIQRFDQAYPRLAIQ